jgi:hypothetical protein
MSNDLTRDELNDLATEKGVENPESYGTKAELQDAIDALETPNEEVPEEQTSLVDDAPEESEPEPEQEAEDLGEDAVAPSAEHEEGSVADGTADNETPQDAFTSRNEAVELGKETARENIERERAENQVDGE